MNIDELIEESRTPVIIEGLGGFAQVIRKR